MAKKIDSNILDRIEYLAKENIKLIARVQGLQAEIAANRKSIEDYGKHLSPYLPANSYNLCPFTLVPERRRNLE